MPSSSNSIDADQLVAHRGYRKLYPENTLLAVEQAIAAGARHVEVDIQLSADKVPFVYHDFTLKRVSGRSGKIAEFDASEVEAFLAYEPKRLGEKYMGETIASLKCLAALMQSSPNVTFYIELKEESIEYFGVDTCLEKVARELQSLMEQSVLISFDRQAVTRAREFGFKKTGSVTRNWSKRNQVIEELELDVLFVNKKRVLSEKHICAQCPVVVYETESLEEAQSLLDRGASMIETFDIGGLMAVV